jgi:hypothetical protein
LPNVHSIDNLVLSQITIILFDCDLRWPDRWSDQESQVKGPHFLLLTLQRVIKIDYLIFHKWVSTYFSGTASFNIWPRSKGTERIMCCIKLDYPVFVPI